MYWLLIRWPVGSDPEVGLPVLDQSGRESTHELAIALALVQESRAVELYGLLIGPFEPSALRSTVGASGILGVGVGVRVGVGVGVGVFVAVGVGVFVGVGIEVGVEVWVGVGVGALRIHSQS